MPFVFLSFQAKHFHQIYILFAQSFPCGAGGIANMEAMMSTTCMSKRPETCGMKTPTLRNMLNGPRTHHAHDLCQASFAVKKIASFSFNVAQLTWQEDGGPTLKGVDMDVVHANRLRADAMRSGAVAATSQVTLDMWNNFTICDAKIHRSYICKMLTPYLWSANLTLHLFLFLQFHHCIALTYMTHLAGCQGEGCLYQTCRLSAQQDRQASLFDWGSSEELPWWFHGQKVPHLN